MSSRLQKVHELFQTEMNKNHVVYTQNRDIDIIIIFNYNYNSIIILLVMYLRHGNIMQRRNYFVVIIFEEQTKVIVVKIAAFNSLIC